MARTGGANDIQKTQETGMKAASLARIPSQVHRLSSSTSEILRHDSK
jgi:hypothetical protein